MGAAPQGGQPPAAGGKGQAPQGGQQFNQMGQQAGFSQMAPGGFGQQIPGMGGQQPGGQGGQQVNLPGYAQSYYQNIIAGQQQPGMGGQQPQQAVPQDLIRPLPGMGGQQGIMQQTYNDFLQQRGLPANLMQPGMGGQQAPQGLPLQQGLSPEVVQQWLQTQQGGMPPQPPLGQTPPGMQRIGEGPRQQPRSAAELAAMGYISEPMRNAPPPQQPPQKQDITAGLRAKAAGMTPQQMQSITQQMRAGAANMTPEQQAAITAQMRKGPQPNNPLAQPQQVRPEDARMQAMRGLQQLGDFKRYMG